MGVLYSLFWKVDPSPVRLSYYNPVQDDECQKDDSCGAIGNFLLWYFVGLMVLMLFSRASVWMSEYRKEENSRTSASASKESKKTSCKRQSKDGSWDSSQMMKKPKQGQLTPVTDSEVDLASAYLEQRRTKYHSQLPDGNWTQLDSDSTEYDSEISISGASSWKESESEHNAFLASIQRRKKAQWQRDLGSYQIREKPCLHCKALRTSEWLVHHFFKSPAETVHPREDTEDEGSVPDTNTKSK
ncbi:serine-rich single-pass membrane protein 1 [Ctenodactylus gundi]